MERGGRCFFAQKATGTCGNCSNMSYGTQPEPFSVVQRRLRRTSEGNGAGSGGDAGFSKTAFLAAGGVLLVVCALMAQGESGGRRFGGIKGNPLSGARDALLQVGSSAPGKAQTVALHCSSP